MTRLGRKIAVPPIGEERLARIERAVVAASQDVLAERSTTGRGRRGWLAATTAMAAGVLAVLALREAAHPLVIKVQAPAPSLVATGAGQTATLELAGAVIEVGGSTRVAVARQPDGGVTLDLARGRVTCDVAPRPGRPPFQVIADDVRVTVVGTGFSVERGADVTVTVSHGMVAVTRSSEPAVTIRQGQTWSAAAGLRQLAASGVATGPGSVAATGAGASAGLVTGAGAGAGAGALIHDGRTPVIRTHEPGTPSVRPEPIAGATESHDDADSPAEIARVPAARFAAPASAALAALRTIEEDDPRAAARRYGEIALRERGAIAAFALYSQTYLLYYKLADRDGALATATLYERRFPSGREAEAISWIRIGALCGANQLEDCRAAAHSYLRRHSTGRFRALAGRIISW